MRAGGPRTVTRGVGGALGQAAGTQGAVKARSRRVHGAIKARCKARPRRVQGGCKAGASEARARSVSRLEGAGAPRSRCAASWMTSSSSCCRARSRSSRRASSAAAGRGRGRGRGRAPCCASGGRGASDRGSGSGHDCGCGCGGACVPGCGCGSSAGCCRRLAPHWSSCKGGWGGAVCQRGEGPGAWGSGAAVQLAGSPAKRAAARRPAAVRRDLAAVEQLQHRLALAP